MALWGKKKKNDPASLQEKGEAAFEKGQMAIARQLFSQAIEKEPTSERLYYRGVVNDIMGDHRSALTDLKKATKLDPKNSQAWYSLSVIFAQRKQIEGAYNSVKQAYEIDQEDFRIANHFAQLMLTSPIKEHRDPGRAVEISKHACELTNWEDEICMTTHREALAAVGESSEAADVNEQLKHNAERGEHYETDVELTKSVIGHFEARFKNKTNELALQNIIPPTSAPVAVQTIQSKNGKGPSVIFTTGLSARPLKVAQEDANFRFVELLMVIPGGWNMPMPVDETIWPWQSLQLLAYESQSKGGFTRAAQVTELPEEADLFAGTRFNSMLLLPNLKGYVDKLTTNDGKDIRFITVVPIFPEEFAMAQSKGPMELFKQFAATKTKPHMNPERKNLAN